MNAEIFEDNKSNVEPLITNLAGPLNSHFYDKAQKQSKLLKG
jgi:hypothetical protein